MKRPFSGCSPQHICPQKMKERAESVMIFSKSQNLQGGKIEMVFSKGLPSSSPERWYTGPSYSRGGRDRYLQGYQSPFGYQRFSSRGRGDEAAKQQQHHQVNTSMTSKQSLVNYVPMLRVLTECGNCSRAAHCVSYFLENWGVVTKD